jgi:hypothetical protein
MSSVFKSSGAKTFSAVAANLESMGRAGGKAVAGIVYREGLELLKEAIPLTPMDTGNLRNTGFVGFATNRDGIEVKVGFGGTAASYALRVHELPKESNFSEPGTGPKYLERPFDQRKRGLARRVADELERVLEMNNYNEPRNANT